MIKSICANVIYHMHFGDATK